MRSLVVLPTYQEAENIQSVLSRIRACADADVLVVDDGSPDGTGDLALASAGELGRIHLFRRPAKAGLGSAYRAGFAWGLAHGYETFVEMDADLSHDPADIPRLLEPLGAGVELTIGSRYVAGGSLPDWAPHRLALSKLGNVYAGWALELGVRDSTSGFRAYTASLLSRIDLDAVRADGYAFQIEMTHLARRAGAQVAEVPIRFLDRARGTSKMSGRIVAEALVLVTWWGATDRWHRRRLGRPVPAAALVDEV